MVSMVSSSSSNVFSNLDEENLLFSWLCRFFFRYFVSFQCSFPIYLSLSLFLRLGRSFAQIFFSKAFLCVCVCTEVCYFACSGCISEFSDFKIFRSLWGCFFIFLNIFFLAVSLVSAALLPSCLCPVLSIIWPILQRVCVCVCVDNVCLYVCIELNESWMWMEDAVCVCVFRPKKDDEEDWGIKWFFLHCVYCKPLVNKAFFCFV